MKSRLAASIYLLSASKCWVNTRSAVSSRSIFTIFDRRHHEIDCSFHDRGFESSNRAVHSSALEDHDAFSELGPEESEFSLKKIKLVSKKLDDFVDNDDFSELDTEISESSTKEIQLVTEKPDALLDDAFSELGPGTSECSVKQLKLVTEKRDHFPNTHSHRRESASRPVPPDVNLDAKDLFDVLRISMPLSIKSRAPVHAPESTYNKESASKSLSSDHRPNSKKLFEATTKVSTTSSTKLRLPDYAPASSKPLSIKSCAPVHVPESTDNKESASKSPSSDYRPNSKKLFEATTKVSTTSSTKLRFPDHAPASTDDTRKIYEMKYPLSVSIKNIPSEVGLPALIEAISAFGKVSGASFVTSLDKFKCCNIDFEDADSSRRAVLAGRVEVGGRVFLVASLDAVDLVAVRITNIKETTADSAVHSICKSAGELVGLTRTGKNGVDAFFKVRSDTSRLDIVKKLNNTVFDLNHWSACVHTSTSNSSEVSSVKEARHKLHSQILDHFSNLNTELGMKKIYLQDLEYLNAGIMYIQDLPPALN